MKILYIIFIAIFIIQIQNISFVSAQSDGGFDVAIKSPIIICSEGEVMCNSDKTKLLRCNLQGTEFNNVIKTCGSGEECLGVDCVKKPLFKIENVPFFPLLSLILAIIIMILWYVLAKNRIKKYWKTK